jgi:hypothetical protein
MFAGVRTIVKNSSTATKPASTASGSETKSSKTDNLPDPDVLVQEIIEDLEAVLEQFREISTDLGTHVFTQNIKG